jgi:L,D-transpeptidase YcbB
VFEFRASAVYFTYITAWSTGDGVAHFRHDIYQRNGVDALAIGTQQAATQP